MTIDELKATPTGTGLVYVFGEDGAEERHPARIAWHDAGWSMVLVSFTSKSRQGIRWSWRTNRPIGTCGHVGRVRLEVG